MLSVARHETHFGLGWAEGRLSVASWSVLTPFQIGSVDVGWLPLRPGDCAVPYVVCQVCDRSNVVSRISRLASTRRVLPKVLGYAAAPRDFSDSHGAHKRSSVVHLNPLIPSRSAHFIAAIETAALRLVSCSSDRLPAFRLLGKMRECFQGMNLNGFIIRLIRRGIIYCFFR